MKLIIYITLFTWVALGYADETMNKIKVLQPSHPALPNLIVRLQKDMLQEKKWDHVLGIAQVYRDAVLKDSTSFRVEPFLMEAYSLLQFCRYDDVKSVLKVAAFYAGQFGTKDDLQKIDKAHELGHLSSLYKKNAPVQPKTASFSRNELDWKVDSKNHQLLEHLDQVIVRTESKCQL